MKRIIAGKIEEPPPTNAEAKRAALHGVTVEISFFVSLVGIAFHPDTRFQDYTFLNSQRKVFSAKECRNLNARLTECFDMCRIYSIDIYELSFNQIKPLL